MEIDVLLLLLPLSQVELPGWLSTSVSHGPIHTKGFLLRLQIGQNTGRPVELILLLAALEAVVLAPEKCLVRVLNDRAETADAVE